jgi:hypothetical protein
VDREIGSRPEGAKAMKAKFFAHERREAAIRAERVAHGRIPLAELWQELTSGRARVVDDFITEERCYSLLGPPLQREKRSVLSDRRRTILEGLFCGQSIKALAFDLALSQSTVSQESRTALAMTSPHYPACSAQDISGHVRSGCVFAFQRGSAMVVSASEDFGMRLVDIVRALALLSVVALVSGCPKKESDAAPEPAPAQPVSDKAGAEPPAAAPPAAPAAPAPTAAKKKDEGGW